MNFLRLLPVLLSFVITGATLSGCGGTKLLKQPQPMQTMQALAGATDQTTAVTLDWIIVRDGPGTWARNADWDQYILGVQNLSGKPVQITNATVTDSLDSHVALRTDRKQLVKGSKQAVQRYKQAGTKIKAGILNLE